MTDITAPRRTNITCVEIDEVGMDDAITTILGWTSGNIPRLAVGVNANVCNLAATDDHFAHLLRQADLAYADGQSVVWAVRLLGGHISERVATTDLIHPLAEEARRHDKRVFLLGAAPGVAEDAALKLRQLYPGLIVAAHHGYLTESDTSRVLRAITKHQTDILLVGMGDPHQQQWVSDHRSEITAPAVLTCGGLLDWISGRHRRAPRWMIKSGLEWLWRLMIEPRRLAGRYIRGNSAFVARLAYQLLASRCMAMRKYRRR